MLDLEKYTFDYFLKESLKHVPDNVDSRVGSVIYDAIAPVCYELAEIIFTLKKLTADSFIQTATGESLDKKAFELGLEQIERLQATHASVLCIVTNKEGEPFELELGERFSSAQAKPIYYRVSKKIDNGRYLLEAEEVGTRPNNYIGTVLPLTTYSTLVNAEIVEIVIPARDKEDDESFRRRVIENMSSVAFGGNVAHYIKFLTEMEDVGACQVFPVWDGGGTVLCVVLDNSFNLASEELIAKVKYKLMPEPYTGRGLAPIGHNVTVKTADTYNVKVSFNLKLLNGFNYSQVRNEVNEAIENYFLNLRKGFGHMTQDYHYYTYIFRSQIIAELMKIEGIANVSELRLNEKDEDITLLSTEDNQPLAFVSEVVANVQD